MTIEQESYKQCMEDAIDLCPPYLESIYSGQGIVIVAGGERYFTNAYVNITLLRALGCTLPVQVWCLGPEEIDNTMKAIIESLPNVMVIDALRYLSNAQCSAHKALTGWQCKAFAVLHSPFEQVFLLDADCFPVVNLSVITDLLQKWGYAAAFWPDVDVQFGGKEPSEFAALCAHKVVKNTVSSGSLMYRGRAYPPFCSGQLWIDKRQFWQELNLVWHLNLHGPDFWYQHTAGDANTWWVAVNRLKSPNIKAMYRWSTPTPEGILQYAYINDWGLAPAFVHRCKEKLSIHYHNLHLDHAYEDLCFEALRDLRSRWDGRPWALPPEQKADKTGYASHWRYSCDGNKTLLYLKWDGTLETDTGNVMTGYLAIVDFRGRKRVVIGPDFEKARFLLKNTQAPLQILDRNGAKWTGVWNFLGRHQIELEAMQE